MQVAGVDVQHTDEVFIGGGWQAARGDEYVIVAPATEDRVGAVRQPGEADAADAVSAAVAALEAWSSTPVAERAAVVGRWLDVIEERAADLDTIWAVEAGMPIRHGNTLHRFATVPGWRSAVAGAPELLAEARRPSEQGEVVMRREPAGVVVAILPYNGPVVTVASKVVPALLAGCPVVMKAAPESHLTMAVVAECARRAGLPDGVVSSLTGGVDVGRALTRDPRVDMVSLTGGHVAAQDVLAATAPRYTRTQLELGGKSPAVILDDAPLERSLRVLVPGATNGTGQVCASLARIIVSRRRHDELIDLLKAGWERLRIGDPLDPATHLGPLINETARARTETFVAQARADGARLVCGGGRPASQSRGYYYEPTLFTDVAPDSELVQREVFGPVTAVQSYRDLDEAVELANGTPFGLSGAVFTADAEAGLAVAGRIRAGSVAVNGLGPVMSAPFGGVKSSGWGRESGPDGVLGFTEPKQILIG